MPRLIFSLTGRNSGTPQRVRPGMNLMRTLGPSETRYGVHRIYEYADVVKTMLSRPAPPYLRFPCVTPSWDNSPRREKRCGHSAQLASGDIREWIKQAIKEADTIGPKGLVFINAWNEWAEGNHLEPCQKFKRAFLEATKNALQKSQIFL